MNARHTTHSRTRRCAPVKMAAGTKTASTTPARNSAPPALTTEKYLELKHTIAQRGYAWEADWAQTLKPVSDANTFWCEYAWVVLCSGMKEQIARQIWNRVRPAVESGQSARSVFNHPGKAAAIDHVYKNRSQVLAEYLASTNKMAFLLALPWIGDITVFHLAKSCGIDCAKPDRHLVRIAGPEGTDALCARLSQATGDRVATVDIVIWRAANLGLV